MTDLEILKHPKIDVLKILSQGACNTYIFLKTFGLPILECHKHLKTLDKAGLIGMSFFGHKIYLTDLGRQFLSDVKSKCNGT